MLFEYAVLEPGTRALLRRLGGILSGDGFFLVGGTALALQIGHRRSIDLDFFTREAFDPDRILESLTPSLPSDAIIVGGRAAHTLNLTLSGVLPWAHLRNRRLLAGQNQRQAATQMGVVREVYDRWERDETEPPVGFWKRIIAFLGSYPMPQNGGGTQPSPSHAALALSPFAHPPTPLGRLSR